MPYIKPELRYKLRGMDESLPPDNPGELNFVITAIILEYLLHQGESYANYNEVIGVLECAKLELYRKLISKYEDKKCEENGEVYYVR